jgi:hypothetical protein
VIGLVWGQEDGQILRHPDEAVTAVVAEVFKQFALDGSARRVWLWLKDQGLRRPLQQIGYHRDRLPDITWVEPTYHGARLHAARGRLPTTHRPRAPAPRPGDLTNLTISAFRLAGRANIAHARSDLHNRDDAFSTFQISPQDHHQPDTSQQRRSPVPRPSSLVSMALSIGRLVLFSATLTRRGQRDVPRSATRRAWMPRGEGDVSPIIPGCFPRRARRT